MAHWIYICPSKSAAIGDANYNYVSGTDERDTIIPSKYARLSGEVTGFPLYTSEVGDIFTLQNPASGLMLRCADDSSSMWDKYWASIIGAYGSDYYRIVDGCYKEALYDQAYTQYGYQILPNKLFRVESGALDGYSSVYADEVVSGKYRMKGTGSSLPQGCLVPATFMVNGELYEGIGNYSTSYFSYKVVPDPGSYKEQSCYASSIRNFVTSSTTMTPKYLKRQAKSNTLELTNIAEGDVLDFGPFPQNVPSLFKSWLESNCTETTGSSEPLSIEITSPNGIHLLTEGMACAWDIKAIPKLQTKTVTMTGETETITVDAGYAGIKEVTVTADASGNTGQPVEVATADEMNDLISDDTNIGIIYKYTGESTDTYENGGLYIVESE